jgi:hypothetical protein
MEEREGERGQTSMSEKHAIQRFLERALAFAYAALEEPTPERISDAKACAEEVLPRIKQMKRFGFTLGEARQIVVLAGQLTTVLAALERIRSVTGH